MNVTSRDCEIVKQLIALYCSNDPEGIDISVEECLDLFAKMVVASSASIHELTVLEPVMDPCAMQLEKSFQGLPERGRERERERAGGAGNYGCGR